jgi:DNA-binding FadR family transcriptional regulator
VRKNRGRSKSKPDAGLKELRLHDVIAHDLGVRIVSGRQRPGVRLDNEIIASARLKVSRSVYREAVRILIAKGLLHSGPRVGTQVRPLEAWQLLDPDVLLWLFEFDPGDKLLADLFELRKIVEPEAARLAASRRTVQHLNKMNRALKDMATYTLAAEAGRLADREFHTMLLRASGNAFLISLTSGVTAAITWSSVFKQRENPTTRNWISDHERVYNAIEAADPNAAHHAMYALLDLAFLDTKSVSNGER